MKLLLGLFLSCSAMGADFTKADRAFTNRQWQSASGLYRAHLKGPPDIRNRALFRTAESEAMGRRFFAAYRLLQRHGLPEDAPWKGRLLLLKGRLESLLAAQSRATVRGDQIERWSPAQWHEAARETYGALAPLREVLLNLPTKEEKTALDLDGMDSEFAPTLWDVAVHLWTDYLLNHAPDLPRALPDPEAFFKGRADSSVDLSKSNAAVAAALFKKAASGSRPGRKTARDYWAWRLRSLPLDNPSRMNSPLAATEQRAEDLESFSDGLQSTGVRGMALAAAARLWEGAKRPERAVEICRGVEKQAPKSYGARQCVDLRASIELPRLSVTATPQPPPGQGAVVVQVKNLKALHYRLYPLAPQQDFRPTLTELRRDEIKTRLKTKPLLEGEFAIGPLKKYEAGETTAPLPPLKPGLYLGVFSSDRHFDPGHSLLEATVINVSHLWLRGSGEHNGFTLHAVNGQTGEPLPGVDVRGYVSPTWNKSQYVQSKTDKEGRVRFGAPNGGRLEPLAQWGEHWAFWARSLSYRPATPLTGQGFVDTDRRVYRRGEKVSYRITFLSRKGPLWKAMPGGSVELRVLDPRNKVVHRSTGALSDGARSGTLALPATGVLGTYRLEASLNGVKAGVEISVEAFEKPRFEVRLEETSLTYQTDASLRAEVVTYQGEPVPRAQVRYTVYREPFRPPFAWWWGPATGERTQIYRGEGRTNDKGVLTLKFPVTPDPTRPERPSRLRIEVRVTDAAGHSQVEEPIRLASAAPWLLAPLTRHRGFATAKPVQVEFRFTNLNGKSVPGEARYSFRRLDDLPGSVPAYLEDPDLEKIYEDVRGSRVHSGTLKSNGVASASAALPTPEPGVYRLEVEAGPYSWNRVLYVFGSKPQPSPYVSTWLGDEARVGQTATARIGSRDLKGKMRVELWAGQRQLSGEWVPGPYHTVKLPITDVHRGGVTLRWWGVHSHQFRGGETELDVPWDLKFTTEWKGPAVASPSKTVRASVQSERAATGFVRIYDARLDSLAPPPPPWSLSLYGKNSAPPALGSSHTTLRNLPLPVPSSRLEKQLGILRAFFRTLRPPQFPTLRPSAGYGARVMRVEKAKLFGAAPAEMNSGPPPSSAPARQNFADTAFFRPNLTLNKGETPVTFKLPDALTRWRVQGIFISKEGQLSHVDTSFVSKNPFELELVVPRPLRVGDQARIPVIATNSTRTRAAATIELGGAKEKWSRQIALDPGEKKILYWDFEPKQPGTLTLNLSGRMGRFQDGERRALQVRPAAVPLLLSESRLQRKGKASLRGPSLRDVRRVHFSASPQTASVLAQSLPALLPIDVRSLNQWVERWVALETLSHLLSRYPKLKKPASNPKGFPRYNHLAPWSLPESAPPWNESEARTQASEAQNEWKPYRKSGGYSWFPGGAPSRFLTLYVLDAFTRVQRLGVTPPDATAPLNFVGAPRADARPYEVYVLSQYVKQRPAFRGPLVQRLNALTARTHGDHLYLLMASQALGQKKKEQALLATLLDGIRKSDRGGSWLGEPEGWTGFQDTVLEHAQMVLYLARHHPKSKHIWPLAQWLWSHRRGNRWASRRGSLEAIAALLVASPTQGAPKMTWNWDGKPRTASSLWEGELAGEKAQAQWSEGVRIESNSVTYSTLMALTLETDPKPSEGPLQVRRRFLRLDGDTWKELDSGDTVRAGEAVRVELEVRSATPLEFVSVVLPRAGGVDPRDVRSGWRSQTLVRYREVEQSEDRLHFPSLPQGAARVTYEVIGRTRGEFRFAPARAQSQFAPELTASDKSFVLRVE